MMETIDLPHFSFERAAPREGLPDCSRTRAEELGHLFRVSDMSRSRPTHVLEDADWTPATGRRSKILRVVTMDQGGEVWREFPDFDLGVGRAIAPDDIEEQCNAHIVGVLEPRGVDNNGAVWITRQCVERILPDRCRRVGGDPALQHDTDAVIRTRPARCRSR